MLKWLLSTLIAVFFLAGCLSSGNDSGSSSSSITGTAAAGLALTGTIDVVDANGVTRTANIGVDGSFDVDTTGLAAPLMLRATGDGSFAGTVLFSLADGITGVFNITPLTQLAVEALRLGIGAGAPADIPALFAAWNDQVNPADLARVHANLLVALARVNANLATQLTDAGFTPQTFDILHTAFTANHGGFDAVLDGIQVVFGEGGIVINNAVGGLLFNFNFQIAIDGFNIGGGNAGGNGGGGAANCDAGATSMTYHDEPLTAHPYVNGSQLCFTGSANSLAFSGKTLTNPVVGFATGTFTLYTFTDADTGLKYEVVLDSNALSEINVLSNAGVYLGQFALSAAGGGLGGGGTYTLALGVSISGVHTTDITINNVPKPATENEFCSALTGNGNMSLSTVFSSALQGVTGSFTVNSCAFNGTTGTVSATLALTSPAVVNMPYTITYTYN
jgi:hypothetical protein